MPQSQITRILSLTGGGCRGVFQAAYLRALAPTLPDKDHIGKNFDLIAGTSTGAISALAVARSLDPNRILDLYRHHAPDIFRPNFRLAGPLSRKKRYDPGSLRRALNTLFPNIRLGDCTNPPVLITASKVDQFGHKEFNTLDANSPDLRLSLTEVILASCAATTYFPSVQPDGQNRTFIDGGLWANDPTLVAVLSANLLKGVPFSDMRVISIGTGKVTSGMARSEYERLTDIHSIGPLFELMFAAQASAAESYVEKLVGAANVVSVDVELPHPIALDDPKLCLARLPGLAEEVFERTRDRIGTLLNP